MKRSQRLRRRLMMLAGLAFVAAMVGLALRPRPVVVDLAVVDRGPVEVTLVEEGRTHLERHATCTAPVTGVLVTTPLRAGDTVVPGAALFRVEPAAPPLVDAGVHAELAAAVRTAVARVDEARAAALAASAARDLAIEEAFRADRLAAAGALATVAADDARVALDVAVARLDGAAAAERAAQGQLAQARAALARAAGAPAGGGRSIVVRAPWAGVVLHVVRDHGGVVAAGEPILELADLASLEVRVPVLTDDAARLAVGTPATMADWGGPALPGRVVRVEPRAFTRMSALGVEEQRTWVVVALDPSTGLEGPLPAGDGWSVQVAFVRWRGDDVVRAPTGALFRVDDAWAAFVVEDGRARRRAVVSGHRTDELVEIVAGLSPGERVVLYPAERVDDGGRVRARAQRGAP